MTRSMFNIGGAAVILAALTVPADAGVDVHIDKTTQRMFVAVDGVTRYVWNVSTGAAGYDTPNGDFRPFRMERKHFSREWDNAPMPYSIFFTDEGHAIHGSNQTRSLGRPASHGCVRLAPRHARKLFDLVSRDGVENASITISGAYASADSQMGGDMANTYPPDIAPAYPPAAAPEAYPPAIAPDVYPPVTAPYAGQFAGAYPPAAPRIAGEVVETTTVY